MPEEFDQEPSNDEEGRGALRYNIMPYHPSTEEVETGRSLNPTGQSN